MSKEQLQGHIDDTIQIMHSIVENDYKTEQGSNCLEQLKYDDHKNMIGWLFNKTSNPYSKGSIVLRLTVIDSFYSTNAAYSYFSIEEMAEKIISIGPEDEAAKYFAKIANGDKDADTMGLFCEPYGIRKNLGEGSKQVSLLSKYAYFELRQYTKQYPKGFPIYDSLAEKMHPLLAKYLGVKLDKRENEDEISSYVANLDKIRKVLFEENKLFDGFQHFDILDALLWTMGKIDGGNLSLLMDRNDYTTFICNLGLEEKECKQQNSRYRIFNNTGDVYAQKLYNKYFEISKEISKNKGQVLVAKPEKKSNKTPNYTYNINNIISYELRKDDGGNAFNGLKDTLQQYMEQLRNFWLKIKK